jgi:hypothetical protein
VLYLIVGLSIANLVVSILILSRLNAGNTATNSLVPHIGKPEKQ